MLKNNFIKLSHSQVLYKYSYYRKPTYSFIYRFLFFRFIFIPFPAFLKLKNLYFFSRFLSYFTIFNVAYTFFIKYLFKKRLNLKFKPRLEVLLSHDFFFQSMLRRRKKFIIYINRNRVNIKHSFNRNKYRSTMLVNKANENPINFRKFKNKNTKR